MTLSRLATFCLATCVALPAYADLSLTGRSTVVAMNMQGAGQEKVWLSGTQIRRDLIDRGKAYSNLFDLKSKQVTVIDHSMRTATVYASSALKGEANAAVDEKKLKLQTKPTGRTHTIQKWECAEHSLEVSMPAEVGAEKLTFQMEGTVWLARNTAEQKEVNAVLKQMQDPEFFMGIPALSKSAPVQARAVSEVIRRLAPLGMLCSVDAKLRYEGDGRVATLSKKLASRLSLTYDEYSTAPAPAGTFEIPEGYRVIKP